MPENQNSNTTYNQAFGAPGARFTWSGGAKDGVGTAYSSASTVWLTIAQGIVTELYYPTVDSPQVKDAQFLFCDGSSVYNERQLQVSIESIEQSLGYL